MRNLIAIVVLGLLPVTGGCKPKSAAAAGGAAPGAFAIQVVAVEARRQAVVESISLIGSLVPNESVEIKAETDGTVLEIGFAEGQRVEKGRLLVALDETKAKAEVSEAEANFLLAKTSFDRIKQLLSDKLISQQEFDQASAVFSMNQAGLDIKRRGWKDTRVYAPFGGITGARQISPGQVISRNTTLTWVVDLDIVKVEVKVPEKYLRQVVIGQPLEFSVAAFPGEKFKGEVYFVSPQLDEGSRTALVKARIANPNGRLRGGMFASLDLTLQLRDSAIVIPEPALMSNGDTFMVFMVETNGTAQIRPVKVGERMAGKVEILNGIAAGEKVIVEGMQKLRPGVPVKQGPPESAAPYLN